MPIRHNYSVLVNTILSKEIGNLLTKVREKSGLSQTEVAERIGLSEKFGQGYISRLEKGKAKNPPIQTILLYLRACGASWVEFFKKLDAIDFKMRNEKMKLRGEI
jgi:transcriptional regulator with XRE-family HTH domain|uniref:XRE family transcriptional regulator n=1 Tax=candidate division WOR-3 bacterium TaxID=2052148 RepID=A0A7C6E9M8_UNCW3